MMKTIKKGLVRVWPNPKGNQKSWKRKSIFTNHQTRIVMETNYRIRSCNKGVEKIFHPKIPIPTKIVKFMTQRQDRPIPAVGPANPLEQLLQWKTTKDTIKITDQMLIFWMTFRVLSRRLSPISPKVITMTFWKASQDNMQSSNSNNSKTRRVEGIKTIMNLFKSLGPTMTSTKRAFKGQRTKNKLISISNLSSLKQMKNRPRQMPAAKMTTNSKE